MDSKSFTSYFYQLLQKHSMLQQLYGDGIQDSSGKVREKQWEE